MVPSAPSFSQSWQGSGVKMANTFVASPHSFYTNPSMKRPTGASSPKTDHTSKVLSGRYLTTFRTLQAHDKEKGTTCAPAFYKKLNEAQLQYADDMRAASIRSNVPQTIKKGFFKKKVTFTPRKKWEGIAKTKLLAAKEAARFIWAPLCMKGNVSAGVAAPDEEEIDDLVAEQDELAVAEAEAEEEVEGTKKRNMMILYAVLGLGAAGTAFFFIRRRG